MPTIQEINVESFYQEFHENYEPGEDVEVKELTEKQLYDLIPECPICGNLQGAENIKICQKHQIELLNKIN